MTLPDFPIFNKPCWKCTSSDACSYYPNDIPHLYCFVCKAKTYNKEEIEEHIDIMYTANVSDFKGSSEVKKNFPERGVCAALTERRIKQATAEKYGVESIFDEAGQECVARAYPAYDFRDPMSFVAQKLKATNQKSRMKWIGDVTNIGLFGQHLFPQGSKKAITITEGEEDALAVYQMFHDKSEGKYPEAVVSVFNGANAAVKECKRSWAYLDSFETIIIAFDGDEAGQHAAEEVAKLFPHKAKILRFSDARKDEHGKWQMKDANDYLNANREKEFINLWFRAEKYTPQGVRSFQSLWDDMMKEDTNTVVPFPWEGVNKLVSGMITGKMDVFKAPPKIGKTAVMSELAFHIIQNSPYSVGLIFLENTPKEIGMKFCGLKMDRPLIVPEEEARVKADPVLKEELRAIHEEISNSDKIVIFDPEDERSAENVINKIRYFVKAHDCRYVFLDHASMLAYKSEEGDERRFLDKLFADLKELTTSLDIYLGVIIHVNDDGKTRGSRAPVQLCDRLYSLHRDKMSPDPLVRNTTDFVVEENRYGECGLASKLRYDTFTGRMTEIDMEEITAESFSREVVFDD